MKSIHSIAIVATLLFFEACNHNNSTSTNSPSTSINKIDTLGVYIDTLPPKWDTVLTEVITRSKVGDEVKTDTVYTRRAINTGK